MKHIKRAGQGVFLQHGNGEIVVGRGDLSLVLAMIDGQLKFLAGLRRTILRRHHRTQIVVRKAESKSLLGGTDKMLVSEIRAANLSVGFTKIIFRDEIDGRNVERVFEKREAILPICGLPRGERCKENEANRDSTGKYFRSVR